MKQNYGTEILDSIRPVWKKADDNKENVLFWENIIWLGNHAKELLKIAKQKKATRI